MTAEGITAISLTVGKVDAGIALLLTNDHNLIGNDADTSTFVTYTDSIRQNFLRPYYPKSLSLAQLLRSV